MPATNLINLGVGSASGESYAQKLLATGPIALWDLTEKTGSVVNCLVNPLQDGAYTAVVLNDTTNPYGEPAPYFNGSTAYANVLTATLQGVFNGATGTLSMWVKVDAAALTDGLERYFARFFADTNNQVRLAKHLNNNTIYWYYRAGGTVNYLSTAYSGTGWFHFAITWSPAAKVKFYLNGTQVGSDLTPGTWAGTPAVCMIGAQDTGPNTPHKGHLAYVGLWNKALEPGIIMSQAQP